MSAHSPVNSWKTSCAFGAPQGMKIADLVTSLLLSIRAPAIFIAGLLNHRDHLKILG
jgi:hypothetical protein